MGELDWPDVRSRVRGLVVGYCLGDAIGRAPEPHRATLVAGTPSMLFLASTEGVVRALVRQQLTGLPGGVPEALWHATARLAHRARRDDLPGVVAYREAAEPGQWPDGWLSELSLLRGGRGSAPAIEAALSLGAALDPRPGYDTSDSIGDLVLARTLPVALLAVAMAPPGPDAEPGTPSVGLRVAETARDVAAYSHGLVGQVLAVALTRTLAHTLLTGRIQTVAEPADLSLVYQGVPHADDVVRARVALRAVADQLPPHARTAEDISHGVPSGPRSALRALTDGLRGALEHPERDQVADALQAVIDDPQPAAAAAGAAVTMALLGAAHGLEGLPADAVARLDVGHVADQLASDLVTQVGGAPLAGSDGEAAKAWLTRYPPS
ncbi:hypothetical protein [Actinotalea solisilvae]|uniref:hypothetical protein n=1 Tax=Actinotalea solisilvae TaxID=2072922 RepID=UPI0018F165EC|nr:hypothetical protein [Actinotalea solisilvae]